MIINGTERSVEEWQSSCDEYDAYLTKQELYLGRKTTYPQWYTQFKELSIEQLEPQEAKEEETKILSLKVLENTYINQELTVENSGHNTYLENGEPSWEEIETAFAGIVRRVNIVAVKAAKLGDMLNRKKLTTPHGEFVQLVEQYCGLGYNQLYNYMLIAKFRPDLVNYDHLSGLPVPSISEIIRIGHMDEQELKKKRTKGRTKAEDAERKQKERAYKSSLKAIGNYNYNECTEIMEEAQKRISQLRPQHQAQTQQPQKLTPINEIPQHAAQVYQSPPQTIRAPMGETGPARVEIDSNNIHYYK